ncbi:GCN5-related N-acetyltransferase protein [Rhizobium gallicum]|uniref:GCN5-related N-acetyltransferase protein n=1 Tax=Rhizobium gallicum TaxID=56730 RepID=A0A1L5NG04_9HYPH|nr:GNAT family N-acetyltransferase [Rhizobium gallicum]APO66853.1 GCN5-related N-acetyltransferase protein [Rhizobium gallicum]
MIPVFRAIGAADFEIAAGFCDALAAWDAAEVQAYGVAAEEVLAIYHGETSSSLAAKYSSADAMMFIARWEGSPAGCLAFAPFDDVTMEIRKFYVDPEFRGKGVGSALMRVVLAEVEKGDRRAIVAHTTVYMKNAISVYEAFDFTRCPPFRQMPNSIAHTEVFMSRPI